MINVIIADVEVWNQHRVYTATSKPSISQIENNFIPWASSKVENILNSQGISFENDNIYLVNLVSMGAAYFAEESIQDANSDEFIHTKNLREMWGNELKALADNPFLVIGDVPSGGDVGLYTDGLTANEQKPRIKIGKIY